jgi:hypothetical protein
VVLDVDLIQIPAGTVDRIEAIVAEDRRRVDDEEILDAVTESSPSPEPDICPEKAGLRIHLYRIITFQMRT